MLYRNEYLYNKEYIYWKYNIRYIINIAPSLTIGYYYVYIQG